MNWVVNTNKSTVIDNSWIFILFCSSRFLLTPFIGKSRQSDDADDDKAQKRSKKVSSLCIQLPAAGLGQRPPSIHSTATDEGGFNEPSPKIEALKTHYDFDVDKLPPIPPPPHSHPDIVSDVTYVDLAHRAQPEGIESDYVYDESESYRKIENGIHHQLSNEKIVYATIKPDFPAKDILQEKENFLDMDAEPSPTLIETDKSYVSPQKMLDPTRAHLHDDDDEDLNHSIFSKKLPPEPISERSDIIEDVYAKPKKIPPPVPELNSPLDMADVEFADASGSEDERRASSVVAEDMTAEEEDRLLSSR